MLNAKTNLACTVLEKKDHTDIENCALTKKNNICGKKTETLNFLIVRLETNHRLLLPHRRSTLPAKHCTLHTVKNDST